MVRQGSPERSRRAHHERLNLSRLKLVAYELREPQAAAVFPALSRMRQVHEKQAYVSTSTLALPAIGASLRRFALSF